MSDVGCELLCDISFHDNFTFLPASRKLPLTPVSYLDSLDN
jgi:hypothetical protein